MELLIARIRVIAKAIPTVLTLIMSVLLILSEQIGDLVPGAAGETIATWCVRIIAWLGTAVMIIRRVTPVPVGQEGILPVGDP